MTRARDNADFEKLSTEDEDLDNDLMLIGA
jgi:hypothetical protein